MDRRSEVAEDQQNVDFVLTDDEMILILKGLDLYGYSLIMSENIAELVQIKVIAKKLLEKIPKPELNS